VNSAVTPPPILDSNYYWTVIQRLSWTPKPIIY